jgi:capsular exopolysaccharide synthesis family protein
MASSGSPANPSGGKTAPRAPAKATSPASFPSLSPREVILCIRERALIAFVLALFACVFTGGWLLSQPKVYRAGARLLVDRSERVLDMAQVMDQSVGGGQNDAMFETYLAQIVSPAMVSRVVDSLSEDEKQRAFRPYADPESSAPSSAAVRSALVQIVGKNVSSSRQGNTFFVGINVRHRDPASAALLASRFATQFIVHLLDRNSAVNNSAIAFLRGQTEELRVKAEASERALQKYREDSGMVSLDESRNIVVDRMKALSATVTAARVARVAIEARLSQAESILAASGDPLELAAATDFSNLSSVQSQLDALRTQRTIMGERYGVRHPAMIDNDRSREALERLRTELIATAMANLRNQRSKALNEETQLQAQLAEAEKESFRLDAMAVQFNVLRREAETNRETYAQLHGRLNETSITAQLENSNVRVADLAQIPGVPVEPDNQKIAMILAVLGLFIFVAYPLTLELIFNRVKGWSDVETYLNLPLLAEFPVFSKIKPEFLPHLLTRTNDEEASETVRSFYGQLKFGSRLEVPKTILVTSTLPCEGKSFVAANLAAAFALHGIKTLIVDTDFRRPSQHRFFDQANDRGLLRWFENSSKVPADLLNDTDLGITAFGPALHLLRAGGTSRRSTEILDSEPVHRLLDALRKHFDVVIIDTPPAGVFADALALAELAGELVYVVRYNYSARPGVRRVIEKFVRSKIEIAGIVLNMMPSGRNSAAFYSGYGHHGSKYYAEYSKEKKT